MRMWLNDLNITNARIVVSIGLAAFGVIVCLLGVTFMGWEPTEKQERLLLGIAVVVLTMQGFDVIQFASKRFSDAGLAAAKNSTLPPPAQPVPQDNGDTSSAPSSLSKTPPRSMDPALASALQEGADKDARLAAGSHFGERGIE